MSGQPDAKCPLCGKAAVEARFAPFCGPRCADIDLGRWLKGGYAIPGASAEDTAAGDFDGGEAAEKD